MRSKKNSLEKKRPLFFSAGLVFAFSLALVSFEWRTPYEAPTIPDREPLIDDEVVWVMPVKIKEPEQKLERPEPPKKQPEPSTTFDQVDDDVPVDTDSDDFVINDDDLPDVDVPVADTPDADVPDDDYGPIKFASEMPRYCGGEQAMFKFLSDNLEYPEIPRTNGITGTVYIEFVVGKDGTLRDAKVKRPVDPWLDAEALRVAKKLDCFTPGKQGGKNVAVYFILPIRFTLGS
jgi:protein TonB